ncbi:MAG: S8 family peptidase [Anaerolineae bacterium]|jgi:thermitase|nr:S8 family peptidase [Anaerolineae bacterium]
MFNSKIRQATILILLLITMLLSPGTASARRIPFEAVAAARGPLPTIYATETITTTLYLPLIMRNHVTPLYPNDPAYEGDDQWGLNKIEGPKAWGITTGSSLVTIAVIDTGVDLDHPDLQDKIVPGWDFVNNDATPDDDHSHGTHVAGIAAATTNNGLGVAGVAWNTRIMPVKVLDSSGNGSMDDVIAGMTYAADHGAQVLNLSLGSVNNSSALQDAVNYARDRSAVVVAAAGNCGSGCIIGSQYYYNPYMYPASCQNVIGVAATTSTDGWPPFSEHNTYVDLSAPGVGIYSTIPNGYGYKDGTSMATPFVSGLAALVLSRWPDYTPSQVETALFNNADDLGSSGRDDYFGYGRINAFQTLLNGAEMGSSALEAQAARPPSNINAPFAPGELLVKFKSVNAITSTEVTSVLERYDLHVAKVIPGLRITLLTVPAGREQEIIAALQQEPFVEYAEPNYLVWALE